MDVSLEHPSPDRGIADHAAGPHVLGRRLELGLHEGEEAALPVQGGEHGRQHMLHAREGDIADRKVTASGISERGQVRDVRALEQGDAAVVAQAPGELRPAHIDGEDARGAALQQAVGEPAGGTSHIQA